MAESNQMSSRFYLYPSTTVLTTDFIPMEFGIGRTEQGTPVTGKGRKALFGYHNNAKNYEEPLLSERSNKVALTRRAESVIQIHLLSILDCHQFAVQRGEMC